MSWQEANRDYLLAELARVKGALENAAGRPYDPAALDGCVTAARAQLTGPPALEQLCVTFGLSAFECDLLLLSAAADLDSDFLSLFVELQDSAQQTLPTFGLALAVLAEAHWSAIAPAASLRHWHLIEVGAGGPITAAPLRIDERVLHFLLGANYVDEQLDGLVSYVAEEDSLTPSHQHLVTEISELLTDGAGPAPAVELTGNDNRTLRTIAARVCRRWGLALYTIRSEDIPTDAHGRQLLVRNWLRESMLSGCMLMVDVDDRGPTDATQAFVEALSGPLLLTGRQPASWAIQRPMIRYSVDKPAVEEQIALWDRALIGHGIAVNGFVPGLATQFSLPERAIEAACTVALAGQQDGQNDPGPLLWDACRIQSRTQLDDVAQRVVSPAEWDDLVLPEPQMETLHEIVAHVRQRHTVYEQWGFAERSSRGLGVTVAFAGASGTGKTLAAEVMANELRLDLYRIDLSAVVSKYIGETEKNLRRVFDAAEYGGAILLFDEADALFGKRSEVKDSHDRYANIEVSYLLQQMETYRGLAILTTNLLNALDNAFLRRIRFVVQFPMPTRVERAAIWTRIFPPQTPTNGLDVNKLARLSVTGGNIRNIALNAAFLAADAGEPVGMAHLLRAVKVEYGKLEKPLTAGETQDWVQMQPVED